jgi:hypothetical protein
MFMTSLRVLSSTPRPGGAQSAPAASPRVSGAAVASRASGASESPARRPPIVAVVTLLLLAGTLLGAEYYFAPPAVRVRSPLHPWLRPSGYVGQTLGIVGLVGFLLLWLYPLRKRYRWLGWTGAMSRWLDLHVGVALVLPLLVAVHASWRFDGLIGLGYASMLVVAASGIVGRYLYVRIPRSATGLELTAEEVAAQRRALVAQVEAASWLPAAQVEALLRSDPAPCDGLGLGATVRRMVQDDLARWRAARAFRRVCAAESGAQIDRDALRRVLRLARREMALTQQARMLAATQRVFRFWHLAHRPFAITALVAVLIHVGIAVAMGMTWFW